MIPLLVLAALGFGLAALSKRPIPSTMANPKYIVKFDVQSLDLAALPSPKGPVMLCSYVPVTHVESTDLNTAWTNLWKAKASKETAPEELYGRTGRRHIVKLVQRFFDPNTFQELPSEVLYESDQKFLVPTSPDSGIPCG